VKATRMRAYWKATQRLRETREWLGVEESPQLGERWLGELYQSANRYAFLRFFRVVAEPRVAAWLLNLYFTDDVTHRPTPRARWDKELPRAERDLGLSGIAVKHSGRALLPGGSYEELVAATDGT
jgi:hypothetical protein